MIIHKSKLFLRLKELDKWLDYYAPYSPTVLFISACYSGMFSESALFEPHRIIFTAARSDRSSFGCGAGDEMPVWDRSLIQTLKALQSESSWQEIGESISAEVSQSEKGFPEPRRSYPQCVLDGSEQYLFKSLLVDLQAYGVR
jgi:hypothetical protein